MSRVRTGHTPDDWRDEGAGAARVAAHGGRMLVAGEYVTSSVRPVQAPTIPTAAEQRRRAHRFAKYHEMHPGRVIPRPCGFPMRYGLTCVRQTGHGSRRDGPGHRSGPAFREAYRSAVA